MTLPTSSIEWELYRSFLAVLEAGSLSGAARSLGVAQPTIGRHVAALETALGLSLFTRSQAGLLPTEAARALREPASAIASSAAAFERIAAGFRAGPKEAHAAVRGVVRVTASEVVAVEVLPPILAGLQTRHPGVTVELVLSNAMQDLLQREADIAVRMTRPRQEQLVARRVGTIELGLHAHADYLARHGTPASLDALPGHALIGYDRPLPFVRHAIERTGLPDRTAYALRTDSDVAQLALIRAGAGIGVCQVRLARKDVRLVRVLAAEVALPLDTWIAMHGDLRDNPACRATFDALAEGLAAYAGGSE